MSNHLVRLSKKELDSLRKKRKLFKQDKKISNSSPFADSIVDQIQYGSVDPTSADYNSLHKIQVDKRKTIDLIKIHDNFIDQSHDEIEQSVNSSSDQPDDYNSDSKALSK